MKFQIVKSRNAADIHKPVYFWHLLTNDGRQIACSCEYATLEACKKDVHYVALSAVSISLDSLLADGDFELSDLFASGLVSPDCPPEEVPLDLAAIFPPSSPEYLLEDL